MKNTTPQDGSSWGRRNTHANGGQSPLLRVTFAGHEKDEGVRVAVEIKRIPADVVATMETLLFLQTERKRLNENCFSRTETTDNNNNNV